MADPLSLLRQYFIQNRDIVQENDRIIFGELSWPKATRTNYVVYGSGKDGSPKEYYTLECLLYFLQNKHLSHSVYVRTASGHNLPVVHRPDRRDLLTYLGSETATSASIDKSLPLERPTQLKRVAEHENEIHPMKKPRLEDGDMERMRQKMAARLDGPKEQSVTLDNITSILALLHGIKLKEEGKVHPVEHVAPTPRPAYRPAPTPANTAYDQSYDRYAQEKFNKKEAEPRSPGQPTKRVSRTPIIVIPAADNKSLITMFNAREILQDLKFVTTEEKRASMMRRENDCLIQRSKDGGLTVPYRVIDNTNRLTNADWDRVVAVFVMGPAWQFKGWPWDGNPVEIFSRIKAFHLKYEEMKLDNNVAKWAVHVIDISRNRRHLDRAQLMTFWDMLDQHMLKCKPHLRF
ncbi:unnamed protein product [Notodromas monacha]|uniref:Parafibromin n=1 Tax=Notodromas monacha TaxID=399045 RepID=A0A7R9BUQ7_9CRUS|nr:unnamed protein product [Notodromas monacha]CAG0922104.1 unnamed protein product [Notodromas monacha]